MTIELAGVTKTYGPKTVVTDLSFSCQPGTITGFLGPNGAGKSRGSRPPCESGGAAPHHVRVGDIASEGNMVDLGNCRPLDSPDHGHVHGVLLHRGNAAIVTTSAAN